MPEAKAHLTRAFQTYSALLAERRFDELDRELFEETWSPSPGLLLDDEIRTIGPLIVAFEVAVADRDQERAAEALEAAQAWLRKRGP